MKDLKIIDNYLSEQDFKFIADFFLGYEFPWYVSTFDKQYDRVAESWGEYDVLGDWKEDKELVDFYDWQFVHTFYERDVPQSKYFSYLDPFFKRMNIICLIRARIVLNFATSKQIMLGGYHYDLPKEFNISGVETAIFYFNTNNGYTQLQDGTKIESVANRLASFPTDTLHSGVSCTDEKRRVQLNLNYIKGNIKE